MQEDPIMQELRATRAALSKRFNYDIRKLGAYLQSLSAKDTDSVKKVGKKLPKPNRTTAKKTSRPTKPASKPSKRRRAA